MRRPGIVPIFLTLSALAVTLSLGIWQMQRLAWKEDLLAGIRAGLAAPPVSLEAHLDNPGVLAHRPVTVRGTFLHDLEAHITPRTFRGTPGLHVITPLRLANGAAVLVNRGWIPNQRRDSASRPGGQVSGVVTVNGILRAEFDQGFWTPEHDAKAQLWFWYDVAGMARARGLDLPPLVILADATIYPGGLPVGGVAQASVRNDHLQYAITWFLLAAVVAAIFGLAHRRKDGDT